MIVELNKEGDELLAEAQKLDATKATQDVIAEALREYIQYRRQQRIISLFGTVEYDDDYDYKEQRRQP
jgi:metal-responsive CopG/Arc/MetJ family transcriptional regulator